MAFYLFYVLERSLWLLARMISKGKRTGSKTSQKANAVIQARDDDGGLCQGQGSSSELERKGGNPEQFDSN